MTTTKTDVEKLTAVEKISIAMLGIFALAIIACCVSNAEPTTVMLTRMYEGVMILWFVIAAFLSAGN